MRRRSLILPGAPIWHALDGHHIPTPMEPKGPGSWMREEGSLTLRLREKHGKHFNVEVLQQTPAQPFQDEMYRLGLRRGMRAVVREVALKTGNTTLILARSIIPEETLLRADPRLQRLGTQPLGEILFSHPELARASLEWTLTPIKGHPHASRTPGRRSLYTLGDHFPLLVAEFFLPEILME
jgi:chorismate lyase